MASALATRLLSGGRGGGCEPAVRWAMLASGKGEAKRRSFCCGDHSLEVISKQKLERRACPGPAEGGRRAGGVENTLFGKVFLIVSNNSS